MARTRRNTKRVGGTRRPSLSDRDVRPDHGGSERTSRPLLCLFRFRRTGIRSGGERSGPCPSKINRQDLAP